MIVQCRQCRTKFRFDDRQIQDDGVWLRCGRCGHVFFQERPGSPEDIVAAGQRPLRDEPSEPPVPSQGGLRKGGADDDVKSFMESVLPETPKPAPVETEPETAFHGKVRLDDIDLPDDGEYGEEAQTGDNPDPPPPVVKRPAIAWKIALWSLLVIVVIPAVLAFVVFPHWGAEYTRLFRQVAGLPEEARQEAVTGFVKLQDIRQRIVRNYVLGNVRIIEGTAVNQALFPVTRIRIRAEVLDAYGVVLGERQSYAGNLLSDEELMNLSEEELQKKLSDPEGLYNANERIPPNGHIPFMIVFAREPSGSIKTTVIVTGAERLL